MGVLVENWRGLSSNGGEGESVEMELKEGGKEMSILEWVGPGWAGKHKIAMRFVGYRSVRLVICFEMIVQIVLRLCCWIG